MNLGSFNTSENRSFPGVDEAVILPRNYPLLPCLTGITPVEYYENTNDATFPDGYKSKYGTYGGTCEPKVLVKIVFEMFESTTLDASAIVNKPPYNKTLYVFINLYTPSTYIAYAYTLLKIASIDNYVVFNSAHIPFV